VIGPGTEANLHALGLQRRVRGVSDFCTIDEFDALPRVGGQLSPNLERIASLRPDLVLVQGRHPTLEQWCRSGGIEFHAFDTDSLAGWEREVLWIGARFGNIDESNRQIAALREELARLRPSAGSQAESAPPQVLLVVARQADAAAGILAAAPGTFLSELLAAAGGANVLAPGPQAYRDLSEETLIRADPAVVLEFWPAGAPVPAPLEIWRRSFPRLTAVREGRVLLITDPDALIPGPRMGAVAREIAAALR
jgi:iron complex transport system substrate-binding protein